MYGFLFDQTYINLIILGFFLFLIMFLWRKITIIEGNYFILEKRVDMIKKTERDSLISKNMEKADVVMNEIFKDSTSGGSGSSGGSGGKKNFCNNVSYCPPEVPVKSQKTISKVSEDSKDSKDSKDFQDIDMSSYMIDAVGTVGTVDVNDVYIQDVIENPSNLIKSKIDNKIEIIEYKDGRTNGIDDVVINKNVEYGNNTDVNNVSDVSMDVKTTECDIVDVIYAAGTTTIVDNMDSDAISVSSDITFGTDQDKSITKKYKKMSIEKLREECVEKSLNSEGSKAILIGRILEYNKKA